MGWLEPQGPFTLEQRAQNPTVQGLRDLGWEQGKTLNFEVVYAEGHHDRLPTLAAALVAKKVDLIVTRGSAGAIAAKGATDSIPIVASGPDLVALGLAQSLARPGGNITGLTVISGGGSILAKRLELLKLALPAAKHIAFIYSPGQSGAQTGALAAAQAQGVTLSLVKVDRTADLEAAFAEISRNRPDAIWCADTVANFGNRARLAEFAARERLPSIHAFPQAAEAGALMSYGVNIREMDRRLALHIDKILKGAKPGELPIERPSSLDLVINLKTAKAIGLVMPQELLLSATQVIE
jgi:putative ABC transport system substrate-binding protein